MYMVDLEEVSILRNSMSMSNSELISAKKHDDLEDSNHRPHPTLLEFQDHKQEEEEEEEEEEAIANAVFLLKKPFFGEIKVKENDEDEDEDADDDGIRTPTSLDHKIPVMRQCPPAPRKSACKPLIPSPSLSSSRTTTTKRKLPRRRNLQLIDVSKEVESMFPPLVFANIGKKIKKARLDCDSEITN